MVEKKYIFTTFMKLFFITAVSFIFLSLSIQMLEDLPDLIKLGKTPDFMEYLRYIPTVFVQISPVITLLSSLLLISEMAKYNELKILEISGINPLRIFKIIFFTGIVITGLTFCVDNCFAPRFLELNRDSAVMEKVNFSSPAYFFYSEKFVPPDDFYSVRISKILKNGRIISANAYHGKYLGEHFWELENGKLWLFDEKGQLEETEKFQKKNFVLAVEPDILDIAYRAEQFSVFELRRKIKKLQALQLSPFYLQSFMHEKISYSFLNLFLLFLVVPFFSLRYKFPRLFVASLSVGLSFIFYGIYSLGNALAKNGKIPPFWGLWLAHIVIAVIVVTARISSLNLIKKNR
jgi:lipopolysaccharide export LptBFGC system permease protein LptF